MSTDVQHLGSGLPRLSKQAGSGTSVAGCWLWLSLMSFWRQRNKGWIGMTFEESADNFPAESQKWPRWRGREITWSPANSQAWVC